MLCAQSWWRLSYPLRRAQPSKHFLRHFTFLQAPPPPQPQHTMGKKANNQPASGPDHPKDEEYLKTVIEKRIKIFQSIKEQQNSRIRTLPGAGDLIRITMPDGNVREGKRYETSPLVIAKQISKSLASNALIAKVNGVLWDMERPIEEDCDLKFFWHSSAHILGEAIEQEYGCKLCIGPCTTRGEGKERKKKFLKPRVTSSKNPTGSLDIQRISIRLGNLEKGVDEIKTEFGQISKILSNMGKQLTEVCKTLHLSKINLTSSSTSSSSSNEDTVSAGGRSVTSDDLFEPEDEGTAAEEEMAQDEDTLAEFVKKSAKKKVSEKGKGKSKEDAAKSSEGDLDRMDDHGSDDEE